MKDWRITIFNGVLLACYFIPSWTLAALKIAVSPVQGFYDRANIAGALYASDHLSLSGLQMIRFAWLVALSKFIVAAFFLVFLVLAVRDALTHKRGADEALGFALGLGGILSFVSLMAAAYVHETAALRLHATEFLLLSGAAILLLVEDAVRQAASYRSVPLGENLANNG
jgi:hypothetical protein